MQDFCDEVVSDLSVDVGGDRMLCVTAVTVLFNLALALPGHDPAMSLGANNGPMPEAGGAELGYDTDSDSDDGDSGDEADYETDYESEYSETEWEWESESEESDVEEDEIALQ